MGALAELNCEDKRRKPRLKQQDKSEEFVIGFRTGQRTRAAGKAAWREMCTGRAVWTQPLLPWHYFPYNHCLQEPITMLWMSFPGTVQRYSYIGSKTKHVCIPAPSMGSEKSLEGGGGGNRPRPRTLQGPTDSAVHVLSATAHCSPPLPPPSNRPCTAWYAPGPAHPQGRLCMGHMFHKIPRACRVNGNC